MTALKQYERLEALGIWRESPEAQRREVIVSFGDATLVIFDEHATKPLAHWSLAALVRRNPGKRPAVFSPSAEPGEELEIEDETLITAVEKVQSALERRLPHPGRLRGYLGAALAVAAVAGALAWLPGALVEQAARVAPAAKRSEIGRAILADMARITGTPCHSTGGDEALLTLADRLPGRDQIVVVPRQLTTARSLPGNLVAVGRNTIAGAATPEAIAGMVLVHELAERETDPLLDFLKWAGVRASARLLITGALPEGAIAGYGRVLLETPPAPLAPEKVLTAFAQAGISSTPYAFAVDPSGETTLPLIEGDPFMGSPAPRAILDDARWIALQDICN